jgi:hypothetical protein
MHRERSSSLCDACRIWLHELLSAGTVTLVKGKLVIGIR